MAESTVRDGDKGIDLLKSRIGQPYLQIDL